MRRNIGSRTQPLPLPWWQRRLSAAVWWVLSLPPVQLSLWRLGRTWRLLLVVGAGILITVVLICTVPLYGSLVLNVSLQRQLNAQAPQDRNIEASMDLSPLSLLFVRDTLSEANSYAGQYLQQFAPTDSWFFAISNSYGPSGVNGKPLSQQLHQYPALANVSLQPYILDNQQALPHMRLLSGHLLRPTSPLENPQIMVTPQLGLKPGDTVSFTYPSYQKESITVTMTVAGVWFPKDLNDPYWNGNSGFFQPGATCTTRCITPSPIFFDLDTFLLDFGFEPNSPVPAPFDGATLQYIASTNPALVTTSNLASIQNNIQAFKSQLPNAVNATNVFVYTQLDSFVSGFQTQLRLFTQPLYIVTLQVVGLALLFVMAMASLLIEDQANDIATLKSRGAGLTQLLLSYALQEVVLALVALCTGPYLAEGLSVAAVVLFLPGAGPALFHRLVSGTLAPIISPQLALEPALAGAFLGVATLTGAIWQAARRDILSVRREEGRSTSAPFWKRLHLDLVLVLLALVGYLELGEFGTLADRQQLVGFGQSGGTGSGGPDLFQVAAPALLLFGGGLLVLRLFPLATGVAARVAARARGATSMLAFAQLARGIWQFSRLALLLTLAVALGIFALTFQASIGANALAQARFLAGADQRLMVDPSSQLTTSLEKKFAALPGVRETTPVFRSSVMTADGSQVGLLAIDPRTFEQVAYWRTDYAKESLATLMSSLQAHEQGLLAGDRQHPIWTLVDSGFARQFALAPGVVFTLPLTGDSGTTCFFVVGAVVNDFPTIGNGGLVGNVVMSLPDYTSALGGPLAAGNTSPFYGPNEYWLRTDGNPFNDARRTIALRSPALAVTSTIDARVLETQAVDDPLSAGMATLLLLGACIAVVLAMLGSAIHAQVMARQRMVQFAVLRTLGGNARELIRILLGQQLVVYLFSLLCGTLLGLLLSTATLPFLQFSTATINSAQNRLPPYLLYFNVGGVLFFDGALVLVFILALVVAARVAERTGLGRALRVGED